MKNETTTGKKILEVTMNEKGLLDFKSDLDLRKRSDLLILEQLVPMTAFSIETSLFGTQEQSVTAALRALSLGEICINRNPQTIIKEMGRVADVMVKAIAATNAEMVKKGFATPYVPGKGRN